MVEADVGAVIVAAGRSRRLGQPKALLEIDGVPILTRLVDVYRSAGMRPIVAVVSEHLPPQDIADAKIVLGDSSKQMIDSLILGIDAAGDVRGVLVQPVDAPFTDAAMCARLLDGARDRFRVLTHDGRPGHPVYVPRARFAAVRARPEGGLRTLLADDTESLEWKSNNILADIDRPADVERWLSSPP